MKSQIILTVSLILIFACFSQAEQNLDIQGSFQITTENYEQFLKEAYSGQKTYLIFVGRPGCGYCESLSKTWQNLTNFFNENYNQASYREKNTKFRNLYKTDVISAFVDITKNPLLAKKFDVEGVPEISLFANGLFYEFNSNQERSYENLMEFAIQGYQKQFPVVFPNGPTVGQTGRKIFYGLLDDLYNRWDSNPNARIYVGVVVLISVLGNIFGLLERTGFEDFDFSVKPNKPAQVVENVQQEEEQQKSQVQNQIESKDKKNKDSNSKIEQSQNEKAKKE